MADRPLQQSTLTATQKNLILLVAFLSWFFGGVQIAITNVAMRAASLDLLNITGTIDLPEYDRLLAEQHQSPLEEADQRQLSDWNAAAAQWYAWFQSAFLFGAAVGGYLFGRLGDRIGRTQSLAWSLFCFAGLTGASWFAQSPGQLLLLRFLACIGIGGTWPNCVSLVAEAWSDGARPFVASSIGMAGNLGIFAMFSLASLPDWAVSPDQWRWVMIVGAVPVALAIFTWLAVPESPSWRATSRGISTTEISHTDPPAENGNYYRMILLGIALATIPLIGGWGSANWMIPWAGEVGDAVGDPTLKAHVGQARSLTSIVGSLFAGVIASRLGRRRTYALASLGALGAAQYAFWFTTPADSSFLIWVALLGFFNGFFFGWLPFFLPELFSAQVRSTGTGLSFNSGRILTGLTIFATVALKDLFGGDYALIGRVTSWVFLPGAIAIVFAPDTSRRDINQ